MHSFKESRSEDILPGVTRRMDGDQGLGDFFLLIYAR